MLVAFSNLLQSEKSHPGAGWNDSRQIRGFSAGSPLR
jgi:hypothetical protein